jgi:uncharacterized cupredoxin-like copper-binding protein
MCVLMMRRHWVLAGVVVLMAMLLSLAVACGDDEDDDDDVVDLATPTEMAMDETPMETMMDETPMGTMDGGMGTMEMGENEVHLHESEYAIEGETDEIPSPAAGEVVFEIHNDGELEHDFLVIKTDLAEGELPLSGEQVDVNATGVEVIDQLTAIPPEEAQVLSVDLEAGNYVLICNIVGHYELGMHTTLTVQ